MKKLFRKAVTVLGSAVMIGATVGVAAAASYPEPFTSNTAIVVGANAAPSDNIAAASIASNLDANAVGGTVTVTGGDSYLLEKTSTKFNLGDSISDVVSTRVTDDNLPTLLADGKYVDDDNDEFDYTQKIDLNGSIMVEMFEDNDYKADDPTVGIKIPNGKFIMNYTLDFTDDPEWNDLRTSDLPLMGKDYYVLTNGTSALTLLDSADDALLTEGETATLSVDGSTYTVTIDFVSSTETKLTVNGETTNSISEGQTYKLSDGSYIGVKDILYSSKDTGVSKVEFSIGSGKLLLTDGSDVELNEDSISGLKAYIATDGGTPNKLTSITLEWTADDDMFVTTDSEIAMPGFGNIKMSFGGLDYSAEEPIKVEYDGDNAAKLKDFPLKDSSEDIDFAYFDGTNYTLVGKDSDSKLITSHTSNLTYDGDTDDWFVVSWNDTKDHESYLMKATNFKNESGTNKTTIQYRKDGSWSDVKVDAQPGDSVTLGNVEFYVVTIDKAGKSVGIGTGTTGVTFDRLYSDKGMAVQLPWINTTADAGTLAGTTQYATDAAACTAYDAAISFEVGQLGYAQTVTYNLTGTDTTSLSGSADCTHYPATYTLNMTEEDRNENLGAGNKITITLGDDSNNEVSVTAVDMGTNEGTFTQIDDSKVYRNFAYSELATEAMWDKSGDQYTLELTYHGDEVTAAVYVTSADATTVSGDAGVMTVNDNAVSTVSGKNLVVVGGSAINSVAAELLGGAYSEAAFTDATGVAAGEFLIQTFTRSGKAALLVAGYNAADTEKAVTYLLNNDVDTTVGMKYKGTSATEASLVVA